VGEVEDREGRICPVLGRVYGWFGSSLREEADKVGEGRPVARGTGVAVASSSNAWGSISRAGSGGETSCLFLVRLSRPKRQTTLTSTLAHSPDELECFDPDDGSPPGLFSPAFLRGHFKEHFRILNHDNCQRKPFITGTHLRPELSVAIMRRRLRFPNRGRKIRYRFREKGVMVQTYEVEHRVHYVSVLHQARYMSRRQVRHP
jgi:hypothetical protein